MPPSLDNEWLLPFSLAAATSSSHLLAFVAILLLAFIATSLLHWSSPGGPAWGKLHSHSPSFSGPTIPGPRGLPIVGSITLMHGLAHRRLAAAAASLSATRLMALSLGATRVVVSSDPDVAREILHSAAFSDRPVKESAYGLLFHRAIGFAPYGLYWSTLRRIASTHLFSPRHIADSSPHRARIAAQLAAAISPAAARGRATVRVRGVLRRASLNNVMASVFGRRYEIAGEESEEMRELRALVDEGYDLLGMFNWADHLPILGPFDLQKIRSRCSRLVPRVNRFVGRIVDEHRAGLPRQASDFVDVLLSLRGDDRLSDPDRIAVLWEMIFRGTDTVAVLIEWALARLTMHKEEQQRVHEELDRVVGSNRAVTESDVGELHYLKAVIKEVLRLHPPGPLLSWARLATSDVKVDGRLIPAGTTAMVNMWAIMRDSLVWTDPEEFRPERFMRSGSEVLVLGSDLRLAPFGSGRRSCPGKGLAMATVSFWLATLLQEYEWAPADGGTRVDFSEVLGLSCEMAVPLTVMLNRRRS